MATILVIVAFEVLFGDCDIVTPSWVEASVSQPLGHST